MKKFIKSFWATPKSDIQKQESTSRTEEHVNSSLHSIKWNVKEGIAEFPPLVAQILELAPDEIIDQARLMDYAYPEDVSNINRVIEFVFARKFFPEFYFRVITKKNTIKHIYARGNVVLNGAGDVTFINIELRDLTEQGVYIQKIQQQNQRLQDIAWIQSHKMRSPVATIMGLVQLFNCNEPNDPVNLKVLEGIKEAAKSLDMAISEINEKTEILKLVP